MSSKAAVSTPQLANINGIDINTCPSCQTSVFRVEEVPCAGQFWHKVRLLVACLFSRYMLSNLNKYVCIKICIYVHFYGSVFCINGFIHSYI